MESRGIAQLKLENARLTRAVEELSILNDLAAEIGRARSVEEITRSIIQRARRAVGAREGVITLVESGTRDVMKTLVRTRADIAGTSLLRPTELLLQQMRARRQAIVIRSDDDEERRRIGLLDPSVRTLASVPLLVGGRVIGILTVYNHERGEDFSPEDVRLLSIMAGQSAQVVEHARLEEERRSIIQTFGQFTSPDVVEEILRRGSDTEGTRRHVCILFMDVRGFSTFAERIEPEDVVEYLRSLFDLTIECVNRHHGIVHQLLGDGLMAIFGAPVSYGNDSRNAVEAALEMLERVTTAVAGGQIPPTTLGIGLHAGNVVAGTIGSSVHREYKVTGDVVNVASRIEQLNKEFNSRLLISEAVYDELDPVPAEAVSIGSITLEGRREPVIIFKLA